MCTLLTDWLTADRFECNHPRDDGTRHVILRSFARSRVITLYHGAYCTVYRKSELQDILKRLRSDRLRKVSTARVQPDDPASSSSHVKLKSRPKSP